MLLRFPVTEPPLQVTPFNAVLPFCQATFHHALHTHKHTVIPPLTALTTSEGSPCSAGSLPPAAKSSSTEQTEVIHARPLPRARPRVSSDEPPSAQVFPLRGEALRKSSERDVKHSSRPSHSHALLCSSLARRLIHPNREPQSGQQLLNSRPLLSPSFSPAGCAATVFGGRGFTLLRTPLCAAAHSHYICIEGPA